MRLSKIEVEAIADTFLRPMKAAIDAENSKREKEHWNRWLKTTDGKLWSKLPKWMKDQIDQYDVSRSDGFKSLVAETPKRVVPSTAEVRDMVIMASIDAKDVGAIRKALEKAFK